MMHRPETAAGTRTRATRPNRIDRLDGVGVDVGLYRGGGDADVAADVDAVQFTELASR